MTNNPDRSLTLWALDVLGRFAPPAMERDRTWREEHSEDEPARRDYESDEQYFLEEQCPSDSTFR
jgi:hypothetical protein